MPSSAEDEVLQHIGGTIGHRNYNNDDAIQGQHEQK